MKKLAGLMVLLILLTGCRRASGPLDRSLAFRARLLEGSGCCFDARITADYGQAVHCFSMRCKGDGAGDLAFTVTEPASLAGITGRLRDSGGELTFDAEALHFELLTDRELSPVSAPWIFLRALRSGHITSVCLEQDRLRLSADDSYEDGALHLDIRLDPEDTPVNADIYWENRRILTLEIENFRILSPSGIKFHDSRNNTVYALHRV